MNRKTRFDRHVLDSKEGEVAFEKGDLVQVHCNDLAKSISSERKLTPMWSEPHRITEKILNSYKLETLEGQSLEGEYHARRLRRFTPREGTELATKQKEVEDKRLQELEPEIELDTTEDTSAMGVNDTPKEVKDKNHEEQSVTERNRQQLNT